MNVTYENEQFLLHNDLESGIVLFSTKTYLEFLVNIMQIELLVIVQNIF